MKKAAVIGSPASHKNYRAALQNAGCEAVIFPDCSYLKKHPGSFDGLLLPGGGDVFHLLSDYSFLPDKTSLDLEQLTALDLFFRAGKPVMGICKGMQLINLYFHGSIGEVSHKKLHQHPGRDVFHPAENLPGSLLHALFGPHMIVNSNHHQCIREIGQNLQVIQWSPDRTAEAVTHLSAPVIGTQWHPERMPSDRQPEVFLLFRYFVSLL